jgi:outer membrane protein OmpA-like peptidoglycan-associated protein
MTAIPKILIMLALWLLYTFLVWRGCSEQLCCAVGEVTPGPVGGDTTATQRYPIDFRWSDPTVFTNTGYEQLRESILARGKGKPNAILRITGQYFEGEPKPAGYDNMGFARADQVRALFANAADSIYLRASLIPEREGVRTGYFEAVTFEWDTTAAAGALTPTQPKQDTAAQPTKPSTLAESIEIRFPFGSTARVEDPAVEQYLDQLAARVKQSGERIRLTGHTDNVGSSESNLELGRRRATAIRNLLVRKGVPAAQISVDSKGESQPTDTNETEVGRHNNRRVLVQLIKQ